jgi:hypothetical protein
MKKNPAPETMTLEYGGHVWTCVLTELESLVYQEGSAISDVYREISVRGPHGRRRIRPTPDVEYEINRLVRDIRTPAADSEHEPDASLGFHP